MDRIIDGPKAAVVATAIGLTALTAVIALRDDLPELVFPEGTELACPACGPPPECHPGDPCMDCG